MVLAGLLVLAAPTIEPWAFFGQWWRNALSVRAIGRPPASFRSGLMGVI